MGQIIESILVSASARDASCVALGNAVLTGLFIDCKYGTLDTHGFVSFQLNNVYKDATIDAATITIRAYSNVTDDFDPRIYIESTNNAAVYTAVDITARSFWGTYVSWNAGAWTINTNYTSPSITNLIDHATGIAGWVPGNWVSIKIDSSASAKGDDDRDFYSWDYDNANATSYRARLTITHTHACNPSLIGAWELNSTTGSCTMLKDHSAGKLPIHILDGQYLDMNGYDANCDEGITIKGSGALLKLTSGSKMTIEQ